MSTIAVHPWTGRPPPKPAKQWDRQPRRNIAEDLDAKLEADDNGQIARPFLRMLSGWDPDRVATLKRFSFGGEYGWKR